MGLLALGLFLSGVGLLVGPHCFQAAEFGGEAGAGGGGGGGGPSSGTFKIGEVVSDQEAPGVAAYKDFLDMYGEVEMVGKRAPSAGFYGMRGKKAPGNSFFGMRGKKGPSGFLGMRGKKLSLPLTGPPPQRSLEISFSGLDGGLNSNNNNNNNNREGTVEGMNNGVMGGDEQQQEQSNNLAWTSLFGETQEPYTDGGETPGSQQQQQQQYHPPPPRALFGFSGK